MTLMMIGDEDNICHVYADGVPEYTTRCFEEAILLFVAVYCVLNTVFCKHAMKTIIYILKSMSFMATQTNQINAPEELARYQSVS